MFARHGIQNALRTRRRSVAFLLLMTLLVTLLGTSLGLSFALQETLRQCRENYSTIGLVEYLGPGYPSTARVVEDAGEVLAEFESRLDRSDPALVDWEPTRMALGYTPALESLTDYSVLENRFALVIRLTEQATRRIKGQEPSLDWFWGVGVDGQLGWQLGWTEATPDREVKLPYYYANVVETLFSSQRLAANQPVLLDVQEGSSADLSQDYNMPSDTIWKAGHYYLVQGVYTENELLGPSYKQLCPEPYQANGVSLSQVSAIDITQPDGTCTQLDGSTDIEAVGQTFQVTSHSLTAQATDRPADLLPFQQSELTLVQGDYYAAGSKGCLISQTLADDLGLDVGGSLPLSLAVREDTLVPYSYWNSQGFDAQDTYTISGIFSANEEYDSMVYIPVREDVDMTVNHCSYTLGQLQIRNGQAQAYVERLQQQLPGSIQITVYDQGYTAVSQSLEDMLRMVQIIAGVCLAVGLGFLVLFGYLLVYRQRGVGRTMIRVGAARRNVHTYFLFCAGTVALPAAVLGWILSRCVGLGVLKLLELMLENGASAELYFSNTALAMQRTATEYLAAPGWGILALIALATLVLALISCLVFSVVSLERRHKRRRTRHTAQGARSRSLKGGALTYARLSARRGGFRSLVPVLAGVCAAVLFCQLTGTVTRYDHQLMKLRADSSVRGFLTDIRGQSTSGLALGDGVVEGISQIPGVTDVTYLTTTPYYFNGFYRDGKFAGGPGRRAQPIGSFAAERYEDELRSGPRLVFTNSLKGAPEFLSRTSVEVEWLEGYDEGFLAADPTLEIDPNTGHIVKDMPPENRCVIPTDMMDEYGIQLGDWIWLESITYPYTNSNDTQIIQVAFRVVGAFVQTGRANNIYANLDMPRYFLNLSMASVYEWSTQDLPGGIIFTRGGISLRQSYSGATFSIPSCTDLTSVKQALHDMGLSEVGRISSIRNFVIINDAAYLTTERAAAQRLWYMQHLFPVVYAIALGLAYLLAFLQVQSRRRELRTMRSVGADRKTAYGSLFLEQLMLAALGAALGAGLCLALGWGSRLGLGLTAAFAVLWLLGAHVALCRANSRHILKNRREVE